MIIGIPVYQKVDLLDVTGPHEVFKWMSPEIEVRLIAETANTMITTRDGFTFLAPHGFADVPSLDVLWVPGGAPEALKLVELLCGYKAAQDVQQTLQYYPDPPVKSTLPQAMGCPFSW